MNKTINYVVFFLMIAIISCTDEKIQHTIFKPTNHIISTLGDKMRLGIKVTDQGFYNFSSDSSVFDCEGNLCKSFLVPTFEMIDLAQNLSDTTIFQWEYMTEASPYAEDLCELLVYGGNNQITGGYNNYMCSIGKGSYAANILNGLAKSVTGDARIAFDEIVNHLLN